jgi:heat-inducible transcriptional repressor
MLVEEYLAQGLPVASKRLAALPTVGVSSATVRNIMADLEAQGLVQSPHTSAGKIPTNRGLRFFVDTLLSLDPPETRQLEQLEQELNPDLSPQELVSSASSLLSHLTQMTCVITLPRRDHVALRQVEFLPLSGDRVLVILVLNDREVENRVIHTDREYSELELNQAAALINREFGGHSLLNIRSALLSSMQADKDQMDGLMQAAIDVASQVFAPTDDEQSEPQVVVSGENRLLDMTKATSCTCWIDAWKATVFSCSSVKSPDTNSSARCR